MRKPQYASLTKAVVLGYLFAHSTRYNRRLTEASSYALWTTILLRLTQSKDERKQVLTVAPQAEIYTSPLDSSYPDPTGSYTTQHDSTATTVEVDLAILLHCALAQWSAAIMAHLSLVSLKSIWEAVCSYGTSDEGPSYDPKLHEKLKIGPSKYVLFLELKRPASRHMNIKLWLRRLKTLLLKARKQVENQYRIAYEAGERYIHPRHGVWLFAASGDTFCLKWSQGPPPENSYAKEWDAAYTRRHHMRTRSQTAAGQPAAEPDAAPRASGGSRTAGASRAAGSEARSGRSIRARKRAAMTSPPLNSLEDLLQRSPPFSDTEINEFIVHAGDNASYDEWAPLPDPSSLDKARLRQWTGVMRIGSRVADTYLEFVRKDIQDLAGRERKKWGIEEQSPAAA